MSCCVHARTHYFPVPQWNPNIPGFDDGRIEAPRPKLLCQTTAYDEMTLVMVWELYSVGDIDPSVFFKRVENGWALPVIHGHLFWY